MAAFSQELLEAGLGQRCGVGPGDADGVEAAPLCFGNQF
jgi:hypothetical protein